MHLRLLLCSLAASAALLNCGETTESAPDAGEDPPIPLAFTRVELEPLSAWAMSLHAETNQPATITLSLMPADAGPFTLAEGETSVVAFGLSPSTEYTLTASVDSLTESAKNSTPAPRTLRVLFDAAHGQTAAAADWVIDDRAGPPTPADATSEDEWKGALSAWAFELARTGRYEVESTGSTSTLSYGTTATRDLSKFDVLVLAEPNNWGDLGSSPSDVTKGKAERLAIRDFVLAGGGVVALADHSGSDRDQDGIESRHVVNALLKELPCGITINSADLYDNSSVFGSSPIVNGPYGLLSKVAMYAGASLTIDPGAGAEAVTYLAKANPAAPISNSFVTGAACSPEAGRVFVYADSAVANDGTGRINDPDLNAFGDSTRSHRAMLMNATAWAAREY